MWVIIKYIKNKKGSVLPVILLDSNGEVLEFDSSNEAAKMKDLFELNSDSGHKYDIKKFGSGEEAQKYLYSCHNCGMNIQKNSEFCNDKCKDFILVYNNPCKWNGDCKMCKFSKRVRKEDDDE